MRKILYCGPSLSGRLTSRNYLLERLGGKIPSKADVFAPCFLHEGPLGLALSRSGSHFYDLRGLPSGNIDEKVESERQLLRDADGLIFVIDSQAPRIEASLFALDLLRSDLEALGRPPDGYAMVFQMNKRDLAPVLEAEELVRRFPWPHARYVESVATSGVGVLEALTLALR